MSTVRKQHFESGLAAARIFARSIHDVKLPFHSSLDEDIVHCLHVGHSQPVGYYSRNSCQKIAESALSQSESKLDQEFQNKVQIADHKEKKCYRKEHGKVRPSNKFGGISFSNLEVSYKCKKGKLDRKTDTSRDIQTSSSTPSVVEKRHVNRQKPQVSICESVQEINASAADPQGKKLKKTSLEKNEQNQPLVTKDCISSIQDLISNQGENSTTDTTKKKKKKKKRSSCREKKEKEEATEVEMKRRGSSADREGSWKRSKTPRGRGVGKEVGDMSSPADKPQASCKADRRGARSTSRKQRRRGYPRQSWPGSPDQLYSEFKNSLEDPRKQENNKSPKHKVHDDIQTAALPKLQDSCEALNSCYSRQERNANSSSVQECESTVANFKGGDETPMEVPGESDEHREHRISETDGLKAQHQNYPRPRIAWNELIKNISVTEEHLRNSQKVEEDKEKQGSSEDGQPCLDMYARTASPDKPWWLSGESFSTLQTHDENKVNEGKEMASKEGQLILNTSGNNANAKAPLVDEVRKRIPLNRHPPVGPSGSHSKESPVENSQEMIQNCKENAEQEHNSIDMLKLPVKAENKQVYTRKNFANLVPDHSSSVTDCDSDCEIVGTTFHLSTEHRDGNHPRKVTLVVGHLLEHLVKTVAESADKSICTKAKYRSCGCTSCVGVAIAEEFDKTEKKENSTRMKSPTTCTCNVTDKISVAGTKEKSLINKFKQISTCDAATSETPRNPSVETPIVITDACHAALSPRTETYCSKNMENQKNEGARTAGNNQNINNKEDTQNCIPEQEDMCGDTGLPQSKDPVNIKQESESQMACELLEEQSTTQDRKNNPIEDNEVASDAEKYILKMPLYAVNVGQSDEPLNASSDEHATQIIKEARECVDKICSTVSEKNCQNHGVLVVKEEPSTKTGRHRGLWNHDRFYRGLSADFESRRIEIAGSREQRRAHSEPPPSLEGEPFEQFQQDNQHRVCGSYWESNSGYHGYGPVKVKNLQDVSNNNRLPYPHQQNDFDLNLHKKEGKYIPPRKRMEYLETAGNIVDPINSNQVDGDRSFQQQWKDVCASLPQRVQLRQSDVNTSDSSCWQFDGKSALDNPHINPFGPIGSKCPSLILHKPEAACVQGTRSENLIESEKDSQEYLISDMKPVKGSSNSRCENVLINPPGFLTGVMGSNSFTSGESEGKYNPSFSDTQVNLPKYLINKSENRVGSYEAKSTFGMEPKQSLALEEPRLDLRPPATQQYDHMLQDTLGPGPDTSDRQECRHPPGFQMHPFQFKYSPSLKVDMPCESFQRQTDFACNQPFTPKALLPQVPRHPLTVSSPCVNEEPCPPSTYTAAPNTVLEQSHIFMAPGLPPPKNLRPNIGISHPFQGQSEGQDQYWGTTHRFYHGEGSSTWRYQNSFPYRKKTPSPGKMAGPPANHIRNTSSPHQQECYPRGASPRYPLHNFRFANNGTPQSARGSPRFGPRFGPHGPNCYRVMQNINRHSYFDGQVSGGPRQGPRPNKSRMRQPIPRLLDMNIEPRPSNGPKRLVPRNVQLQHKNILQTQSEYRGSGEPVVPELPDTTKKNGSFLEQQSIPKAGSSFYIEYAEDVQMCRPDNLRQPLSSPVENAQQKSQTDTSSFIGNAMADSSKQPTGPCDQTCETSQTVTTNKIDTNKQGLGLSLVQEYGSPETEVVNETEELDTLDQRPASQEEIPYPSQESIRDISYTATGSFTSLTGNSLTGSSACSGIRIPFPPGGEVIRPLHPPGLVQYPGYNMKPPGPPPNLDWKIMSLSDYGSSSGTSTPTISQSPRRPGLQLLPDNNKSSSCPLEEGEIPMDEEEVDDGPDDWFDADEETLVQLIKQRQAKLAAKESGQFTRPHGTAMARRRTRQNTPSQNSTIRRVQGAWANDIPTFPRDHPKQRWSDLPSKVVAAAQQENILAYKGFTPRTPTTSPDPLAAVSWGNWKSRFKKKYEKVTELYIDTHCHLDFLFNSENFKGTFQEYRTSHSETFPRTYAGCIAVFCHPRTFSTLGKGGLWEELLKEGDIWGAVGCHPKHAQEFSDEHMAVMYEMLQHHKVKAVGEIGLDYSGTFDQHASVQKIVFKLQLDMALKHNMPIVIHCRKAEEDCIQILEEKIPRNHRIHRHCFTGTWEECKTWMQKFPNSYIGLTPLVTFKGLRSEGPRDVARLLPLDKLLLETDAPFFVPRQVPRGSMQNSHPGMAITVAEEVAFLKGIPMEQVLQVSLLNARRMYDI